MVRARVPRYRESWADAPPGSWGRPMGSSRRASSPATGKGPKPMRVDAREGADDADSDRPLRKRRSRTQCCVSGTHADPRRRVAYPDDAFPHDVADALAASRRRSVAYTRPWSRARFVRKPRGLPRGSSRRRHRARAAGTRRAARARAAELESALLPCPREKVRLDGSSRHLHLFRAITFTGWPLRKANPRDDAEDRDDDPDDDEEREPHLFGRGRRMEEGGEDQRILGLVLGRVKFRVELSQ